MTNNNKNGGVTRAAIDAFLDHKTGTFGHFHVTDDKIFTISIGRDGFGVTGFVHDIVIRDADGTIHRAPNADIGHRRVRKLLALMGL